MSIFSPTSLYQTITVKQENSNLPFNSGYFATSEQTMQLCVQKVLNPADLLPFDIFQSVCLSLRFAEDLDFS